MYFIKELKFRSLQNMRSHYFLNVVAVFMVSVLISIGYNYTMINNVYQNSGISVMLENQHKTNVVIIEEFLEGQSFIDFEFKARTPLEKYTKGYFSVIVNEITGTGSVGFGIMNGINKIMFGGRISESISIFIMVFISVMILIFIRNVVVVGKCRYFLEQRIYKNTGLDRLIFVYRTGAVKNVVIVMLIRSIRQTLWNFTIIGGIYKHYEYVMIPYILAENPNITYKEAFAMSKKLMMNDKLNAVKIDLTLLPWLLLDGATMHMLTLFFLDPYKECIYSELYVKLREKKKSMLENPSLLYDVKLFKNHAELEGYPDFACPTPYMDIRRWLTADYDRTYSFYSCVLFFFSFSIIGWLWEVFFYLVNEGKFINRGTMFGPWVPIYGLGGLVILVLLKSMRKKPALLFLSSFIVCGSIEYMTSWILETFFHSKWWDYTGYFCNLNGRICLEGLLVFGLAGTFMTYFLAPIMDNLFNKLDNQTKRRLCVFLVIFFLGDLCYSIGHPNAGDGITENFT